MEISQRIKTERQTAEWTQEQLADKILYRNEQFQIGKQARPFLISKVSCA